MEKYLVDAPPPLRQSRPADYSCDTAAPVDGDDDEDVSGGRVTPAVHVRDVGSLRSGTGTLPDVKPLRSINSDGKYCTGNSKSRVDTLNELFEIVVSRNIITFIQDINFYHCI